MTPRTKHLAILGTVLLASLVALLSGPALSAAAEASAFQSARCPMPLPPGLVDGEGVRCGYVTVPERHANPQGKTIQLAVAVLKSTGQKHLPDPIVFIDGGPGFSSLDGTFPLLAGPAGQLILETGRDLVMVEQRGNFYSRPALTCPGVFAALTQTIQNDLGVKGRLDLEVDAYETCRDHLTQQGIDLSAYNTIENAADFPVIVRALGYRDYNVYGVSYGTEVAQALMRDHPEGIRSVAINAVLPLDLNVNSAIPTSADRSFKLLFATCAADAACSKAYPDLEAVFETMVARLNAVPARVPVRLPNRSEPVMRSITGDDVVRNLSEAFDEETIPTLPQVITDLARGDTSWLARRAGASTGNGTEALGMSYAAICAEGADFSMGELANDTAVERAMAAGRPQEMLAVCSAFEVHKLDRSAHKPLVSPIPALLMTGDFDIITPPPFAERVARGLSHAYSFSYPGEGHGGIDICRLSMTLAFYDDPSKAPDASCIKSMQVVFKTPAVTP